MPVFVAALVAATVFCTSVLVLNGLTLLALRLHLAPADMGENGLAQYGLALVAAGFLWRRAGRRNAGRGSQCDFRAKSMREVERRCRHVENVAIPRQRQEPYP
ncbi:hypothetical protein [Methylobacterium sp.]|jgi:hypothetical protein|uniref:hypothetical protein n=1 Tax=Methylobacterium sp. TaxID=409 RepID=UPI0034586F61|nr:hypothetical protein [Methylobacterium sp.]